MNLLSGGLLGRYCRAAFWTTPCCRDVLKSFNLINTHDTLRKQVYCRTKTVEGLRIKLCTGNLRVASAPTLWTQVRFHKDCPRLHRDVEFPNFDAYRKNAYKDVKRTKWGDESKGGHMYFVGFFGLICCTYGLKAELTHFVTYMAAAADVLALASIEVDLGKMTPGMCLSYKWRGKPLFIKYRTQADIELEEKTPLSLLRDPQTEGDRTIKPEWLVVIGICTHLGCVPIPNAGDWPGGFYCPCHGSHYDNIGRTRKGPAPLNLEVPPYKFISDTLILVG